MKSISVLSVSGVTIIALLAAAPNQAFATASRYFHSSSCQVAAGAAFYNTAGQIANTGGADLVLWCPLIIDPTVGLPATGATMDVNGYANSVNNAVSVKVCAAPSGGWAAVCSNMNSGTNASGVFILHPTIPTVVPGDYPYLVLTMKTSTVFFGYTLNN